MTDMVKKFSELMMYRNVKLKLTLDEFQKIRPIIYELLGIELKTDDPNAEFHSIHRYRNNGIFLLAKKGRGTIPIPIGEIYRFSRNALFFRCIGYDNDVNLCIKKMNEVFGTELSLDKNHLYTRTIRQDEIKVTPFYKRKLAKILTVCPKCGEEISLEPEEVKFLYEVKENQNEESNENKRN